MADDHPQLEIAVVGLMGHEVRRIFRAVNRHYLNVSMPFNDWEIKVSGRLEFPGNLCWHHCRVRALDMGDK